MQLFAIFAALLAAAGVIGIAIAATDWRTKGIGIWPATWWAMHRWLNGHAYRIDMPLWLYPAAGAAAFVIAVASVGVLTGRQRVGR